jgi:hypothetical protein
MDFNEALAKAKEYTSKNSRHFKEGDDREAWEREFARCPQFEAAYNEWLQVRADEGCPCRKLYPTGAKPRIGRCSVTWGIC